MSNPAIFLDKDGTLIPNIPYNVHPAKIELAPTAGPALARLHQAGYRMILVTNQPGVAYGYFDEAALGPVFQRIQVLLEDHGVPLDGTYYCPHHPTGQIRRYRTPCTCRKPQPGLLVQAAADWDIDLRRSWLIGDTLDDVEAGRRAGCRAVLVDNGGETLWQMTSQRWPHGMVRHLGEAADCILRWTQHTDRLLYRTEAQERLHVRI